MDPILARLSDHVATADTLEGLTRPLLELLQSVTGLESTYLTEIDLGQGVQRIVFARNTREMVIPEGLQVPWEDTLCKRALDEGRAYTDDVGLCWGDSEAAQALGIQTYLSTPVRAGGGRLYGTLCGASASKVPLFADAERVLAMFARLIGHQAEREQLLADLSTAYAELASSALRDPVTGLPNRRAVLDELKRAVARSRREGTGLLVAFIDLDGFKSINDRFGHEAGDQFLACVGAKLGASLRESDLLARFGGDEFVVVAPAAVANCEASVAALRQRLEAASAGAVEFGGQSVDYAGASVGVVCVPDGMSIKDALSAADAAMYAAKRERRAPG